MNSAYKNVLPKLYLNFFSILNFLGIISRFINIKLGITASIVILILVIAHFRVSLFFSDRPFVVYLICNCVSVISYIWNERPLSIFIAAISFNLIPSLLYYLGKYIGNANQGDAMIDRLLSAVIFMMAIGTVAYLLFPTFYYNHIGVSIDSYTLGLVEYRYGSFVSSLALGSIGTICVILYFYRFEYLALWKKTVYLPLIIVNVILCMQRSAWLTTLISLIVCLFLGFWGNHKSRVRLLALSVLYIIVALIALANIDKILTPTQLMYFKDRLNVLTISEMISSRSTQWIKAWNIICSNPITGFGLGSCGQKAAAYNLAIVTDGNHLRILAEIGFVGFLAFTIMNIRSVIRSIRGKNYYLALVVIVCNIAAIGSPIFDQYYSSFAFWLILGLASTVKSQRSIIEIGEVYETI